MEQVLFYVFSVMAVIGALSVVFHPNMTRALLSLIVTMASLSVLYLLLGAHFVAMINIIIYAGAVLVLFLFVIMLQGVGARDIPLKIRFTRGYSFFAILIALIFGGLFISLFGSPKAVLPAAVGMIGSVEAVGQTLFFKYLLPFELISILLLVGIFAAVALGKKDIDEDAV